MKEESKSNYNDEVDLISLFKFIFNAIQRFLSSLFFLIIRTLAFVRSFVIKKLVYLIVFVVLGGLAGYFYSTFVPPVYETSLTIKSEFLNGFDFLYEIEKLNDYIQDRNYDLVAQLFKTENNNVKVLKGISADSYYNYHNIFERYGEIEKLDSLSVASEINSSLFVVTIAMNSNALVLDKIENWLVSFFDKNELLTKNYIIRKRNLTDMKIQLKRDLDKLDSLKIGINNNVFYETGKTLSKLDINIKESDNILENTVNVYDRGWDIFTELQEVEKQITLIEKITIVNGVKLIKENQSAFMVKCILVGAFVGPVLFLFLYLLGALNSYLAKFEEAN